MFTGKYTDK